MDSKVSVLRLVGAGLACGAVWGLWRAAEQSSSALVGLLSLLALAPHLVIATVNGSRMSETSSALVDPELGGSFEQEQASARITALSLEFEPVFLPQLVVAHLFVIARWLNGSIPLDTLVLLCALDLRTAFSMEASEIVQAYFSKQLLKNGTSWVTRSRNNGARAYNSVQEKITPLSRPIVKGRSLESLVSPPMSPDLHPKQTSCGDLSGLTSLVF